jgi:cytolysin (calcineurin-like family phosphatase)
MKQLLSLAILLCLFNFYAASQCNWANANYSNNKLDGGRGDTTWSNHYNYAKSTTDTNSMAILIGTRLNTLINCLNTTQYAALYADLSLIIAGYGITYSNWTNGTSNVIPEDPGCGIQNWSAHYNYALDNGATCAPFVKRRMVLLQKTILRDKYAKLYADVSVSIAKTAKINKLNPEDIGFYMILASDPQYNRSVLIDEDKPDPNRSANSKKENEDHVKSINTFIDKHPGLVKGLIINGDITEYGNSNELDFFKSCYKQVKVPYYAGLGNHDYQNNVDDIYKNENANRMVNYMIDHVKNNGCTNKDVIKVEDSYNFPSLTNITTASLAYSWDEGKVHFVQLNNFPYYLRTWHNYYSEKAKEIKVNIKSSLGWLANDLALARRAGKVIILNYHMPLLGGDGVDKYPPAVVEESEARFKKMLSDYKVSAVFVGHYHQNLGIDTNMQGFYGKTPVFYCGSAIFNKYLSVQFIADSMIVQGLNSIDGNCVPFAKNISRIKVYDSAVQVAVPATDGWVTFFNEAGYVAKYYLTYTRNGKTETFKTGNIALGNKRRYEIPGDATNIIVEGQGKTGLLWDMWRTTFKKTFSTAPNQCFKSYGTTLHQKWNNNCD